MQTVTCESCERCSLSLTSLLQGLSKTRNQSLVFRLYRCSGTATVDQWEIGDSGVYLMKSLATHNMISLHVQIFCGRDLHAGPPLGGHFPLIQLRKRMLDLSGQLLKEAAGFINIGRFLAVPDGQRDDFIALLDTLGKEGITTSLHVSEHRKDICMIDLGKLLCLAGLDLNGENSDVQSTFLLERRSFGGGGCLGVRTNDRFFRDRCVLERQIFRELNLPL